MQFYCPKIGGIKDPETKELIIQHGTREKGPWFNSDNYEKNDLVRWAKKGHIVFMEKEVK